MAALPPTDNSGRLRVVLAETRRWPAVAQCAAPGCNWSLRLRGKTWGRDAMNDLPDGTDGRPGHADAWTLADRPAFCRAAGARGGAPAAAAVVRVLPAEDRGAGAAALDLHPPAGAAAAALRLGHLRRRRQHAAAHPRHGGAHRAGDRPGAGGAPDLRGRDPGGGGRGGAAVLGGRRAPHRGAARRSAAGRGLSSRTRAAIRSRWTWWPG